MKNTTLINYPTFKLEVEWYGEEPEPNVGFNGSFEIEKVVYHKELPNGSIETADITDLMAEFDLLGMIDDKVGETFIETMKDRQEDLFETMRDIFHPENE